LEIARQLGHEWIAEFLTDKIENIKKVSYAFLNLTWAIDNHIFYLY